jgi:dephospho-CoA kinase
VIKKIGITGGIGAGKSLVSKIIEAMGYPVFNSDEEAKKIVNFYPEVKSELIELFGISIYGDNEINRKKLAELIFNNPPMREKVNQIIHPRVRGAFNDFSSNSNSKLVFNEAAILFETGAYKQFGATILITSPKDLRIKRLLKRDNSTIQEIESRMKSQWTENQKMELANYVIQNNEQQPLILQIEKIISELLN